jgi:hypothetical protein
MISRPTCSIPGTPVAFQAHLQHSQRRCSPRVLNWDSRCSQTCRQRSQTPCRCSQTCHQRSQTCRRHSQVHPKFSLAHRGVPKLITITPMVLLYQSSEISVTLKASRNALQQSNTLPKLTHLSLHSTFSQTLLEASRD